MNYTRPTAGAKQDPADELCKTQLLQRNKTQLMNYAKHNYWNKRGSARLYKTHHHHHHQSLNREGRWGTTDDFATSFLHFCLFSTALWDLPNSRHVHSLILSSHLFLCLPCLLSPFTVPCRWFWPDLLNGKHDHTTTVCVSLQS